MEVYPSSSKFYAESKSEVKFSNLFLRKLLKKFLNIKVHEAWPRSACKIKILPNSAQYSHTPRTFLIGKFNNFLYCALIAELITDSKSAWNFDIEGVSSSQKKSKMRFRQYFWPNLGLILPEFWFSLFFDASISLLLEISCWIRIWNQI